jgi:hypothetical protein
MLKVVCILCIAERVESCSIAEDYIISPCASGVGEVCNL